MVAGAALWAGRTREGPPTACADMHQLHIAAQCLPLCSLWPDILSAACVAQVNDCYAGLAWVAANVETLGIDAAKIVIGGASAGGGLAAGTALKARDMQGPALAAQL